MQPLRLTLRTLLAYLDDTLDPTQAKLIGQKIGESDQARELIERINQVTRRRRITTPPADATGGKLDPNTVGEYLDNTVAVEQASEVEEICLASDAHLAEVAACHQILSLILGEPALVPPSAKQRMYGLVKGPEAIPFRKPPAHRRGDVVLTEPKDVDDTLRLGVPPVSGQNRGNPWILAAGGLVALCLLIVAVWQVLRTTDGATGDPKKNVEIAQGDDGKNKKKEEEKQSEPNGQKSVVEPKQDPVIEPKEGKKDGKKDDEPKIELPPVPLEKTPPSVPSDVQAAIGKFIFDAKEPGILLEQLPDKGGWQRIAFNKPQVTSGRPLVSLPATTSTIQLTKGLTVTLVGNSPELFFSPIMQLFESSIELHATDQLDADLTLRRGRVRIASGLAKPARVRVRFDNPTLVQSEHFDLTLEGKGAEVLLDRWAYFPPGEKFQRDAKNPNRLGPIASVSCIVLNGSVQVKTGDVTRALVAPPGLALVLWNSRGGLDAHKIDQLPEGLKALAPLPQGVDPRIRKDLVRARDNLSTNLANKGIDVALTETLGGEDPGARRLAVRCLGAVDDVATMVDLLGQDKERDLRLMAIDVLRTWTAVGRDHEFKLYDALRSKYRGLEADSIMSLLRYFAEPELGRPDTYEYLIASLNGPQLPVRELAAWHLYQMVPSGRKISYDPAADVNDRLRAQQEWRKVIPPGKLPPAPKK